MKRVFEGKLNGHIVRVIAEVGLGGNGYRVFVDGARIGGASSDRLTLEKGIELGKDEALKFLRSTGQLVDEPRYVEVAEEDAEEVVETAAADQK